MKKQRKGGRVGKKAGEREKQTARGKQDGRVPCALPSTHTSLMG